MYRLSLKATVHSTCHLYLRPPRESQNLTVSVRASRCGRCLHSTPQPFPHPLLRLQPSSDCCSKRFPFILNDNPSCYSLILGASLSVHQFEWHRRQSFPCWQENRRGLVWCCIRRYVSRFKLTCRFLGAAKSIGRFNYQTGRWLPIVPWSWRCCSPPGS